VKAEFRVEFARVMLCVKMRACEPAAARFGDERVKNRGADAGSACTCENGHAPDLHRARVRNEVAAGADGGRVHSDDRMHGRSIRPIVLVDFFIRRNALLFNENAHAHRACGIHACGVEDVE
jgi:hypothetical protein